MHSKTKKTPKLEWMQKFGSEIWWQQSCKIPRPWLFPCSLHLFSQFSSLLPSASNALAQEAQQSFICKAHVLLAHLQCAQRFFQLRLLLSSLVYPQLQNSSHFQRFLSPLILNFLRAGWESWNVWCANHLHWSNSIPKLTGWWLLGSMNDELLGIITNFVVAFIKHKHLVGSGQICNVSKQSCGCLHLTHLPFTPNCWDKFSSHILKLINKLRANPSRVSQFPCTNQRVT